MINELKMRSWKCFVLFFFLWISLRTSSEAYAQTNEVVGKVTDTDGVPLIGATVLEKGTMNGVVADIDGEFRLSISVNALIEVSFLGFVTKEITYSGESALDITLTPDLELLQEVVVVGYGSQKKGEVTASVSSISSKDVELHPIQRAENMIQGKVAGVVVTQSSGAPGSGLRINVRDLGKNPLIVLDGFIGGDINSIAPSDIEDITVLKDAAATSIYGARGAHGVVIVTTKGGKKSQPLKIDIGVSYSISQIREKIDLLDADQYIEVVNREERELGENPISGIFVDSLRSSTDWQDEVFRNALSRNYQLSASKGNETSSFRLSVGAQENEGIIRNTSYSRYNVRFKSASDLTNSTSLNLNIGYTFERLINTAQDFDKRNNPSNEAVEAALGWAPNFPIMDPRTGDFMAGREGYGPTTLANPRYLTDAIDRERDRNVVQGSLSLTQEILEGLEVTLYGGSQITSTNTNTYSRFRPDFEEEDQISTASAGTFTRYDFQTYGRVDYAKNFGVDHQLKAMILAEVLSSNSQSSSFTARDFFTEDLGIFSPEVADQSQSTVGIGRSKIGNLSYLTRINYSYQDKWLLTASLRRDASSRLARENRVQYFPGLSMAYRLGDEPFFRDIPFIYGLKLRAGYGETGNVNSVRAFQIQDLLRSDYGLRTLQGGVLYFSCL